MKSQPGVTRKKFVYNLSKASYRKDWGAPHREPGIGARILAVIIRILPKVGPLKALSFMPPTPQSARLFEDSFNGTLDQYRRLLADTGGDRLALQNRDFDTGKLTRPGEYRLADNAYSKLAEKLAERDPGTVDAQLLKNVLGFYADLDQPFATKKDARQWGKTLAALEKLRGAGSGPGKSVE